MSLTLESVAKELTKRQGFGKLANPLRVVKELRASTSKPEKSGIGSKPLVLRVSRAEKHGQPDKASHVKHDGSARLLYREEPPAQGHQAKQEGSTPGQQVAQSGHRVCGVEAGRTSFGAQAWAPQRAESQARWACTPFTNDSAESKSHKLVENSRVGHVHVT